MKKKHRYNKSQSPTNKPRLAELTLIAPSLLVRGESDNVGLFFLMLGVIFNDIKDLTELMLHIQSAQRHAIGPDCHELIGKHTMLHRFMAGALHELMNLIEENKKILDEDEFKKISEILPIEISDLWREIVNIALAKRNETPNEGAIKRALTTVRNTAAFHYNALSNLSKAWDLQREKGGKVAYSMGTNTPTTRFHYADLGIQIAMDRSSNLPGLLPEEEKFDKIVINIVYKTHQALAVMLRAFLEIRKSETFTPAV